MRAAAREVTESVGLEPFGGKEKKYAGPDEMNEDGPGLQRRRRSSSNTEPEWRSSGVESRR